MLESESERDSESAVRRLWNDSVTYYVVPMNPSFIGDGRTRCVMRRPAVHAALRRMNGNTTVAPPVSFSGASGFPPASCIMMLAKEKVRRRTSS